MSQPRPAPQSPPGLPARRVAAELLEGVLRRGRPLDLQLEGREAPADLGTLSERDRALVRRMVGTVLRRLGRLRHLLAKRLDRGLPQDAPRVETALLIGAAQILWLDVPDHAAVDLSVRLVQADRRAGRYAGLVNAVLRRIARDRDALAELDAMLDTPAWLMARWVRTYGEDTARAIAAANAHEPALDLTVKSDPAGWAERLQGRVLPTGSVRTLVRGTVTALPGFAEGAWWVQDAAAALPARLFGDLRGRRVADLCAAPGGKTAQLAFAGAHVTAVDRSPARLARVRDNLDRLALAAELVAADATEWKADPFDAVLLDAPCSSTGTIRRHPDIPWLKREADVAALAEVQTRLITHAVELLRPGGVLIYCTCSLEPEEGEDVVANLLKSDARMRRAPISPDEIGGLRELLTPAGDLRTLPCHLPDTDPQMAGLDGFFAARLQKI
ncbi:MAG TPA: RsmB/NOP family class I SAM-dependent RNA methyltransferase [Xanthobacteraceae bacterium]|jgi:16S rRNA (cytosine967-C5)-methyltransferase|nr:RsmB/NOP family class I SAM-dependent RNA methyltransferase [Xanthobacteraceae bacterium]